MLLNNSSRVIVFWQNIQWLHVRHILVFGLPTCIAGAYSYTLLSADWVALLLGTFLLASVPLRRILHKAQFRFSTITELGAGAAFGFINGGMSGTGVILISILMSVGVAGSSLVATDAVIAVTMGSVKIIIFGSLAALNLELALTGLLIDLCTMPGALVSRVLLKHIPASIHA